MVYTLTERGEKILWCIIEEDAQTMAKRLIGRELTEDELYGVRKGLEWGLGECYADILETAIQEETQ